MSDEDRIKHLEARLEAMHKEMEYRDKLAAYNALKLLAQEFNDQSWRMFTGSAVAVRLEDVANTYAAEAATKLKEVEA